MVAKALKSKIESLGISYSFISSKTGIPIDAISRVMLGKRRLMADEMIAICGVIGVDLNDLRDPAPTPPEKRA